MAEKLDSKQTVNALVTKTVTPITTEDNPTEPIQHDEKRPSAGLSRQTVNSAYNITRGIIKLHSIVDPSAADFDDDDFDDNDDEDDDDDFDDDEDEYGYEEDDDEIDDMREGDEPLSGQQHSQSTSDQYTSIPQSVPSSSGVASGVAAVAPSTIIRDARDPTAARYRLLPEQVQPENAAASNNVTKAAQIGPQPIPSSASPTLKPNNATALSSATDSSTAKSGLSSTAASQPIKSTSLPKPRPVVAAEAQPGKPNMTKSVPASSGTQASTSTSTSTPAPPRPKVDPCAPTAAAPYGYKIVTVKKPDGTLTKVKRPLKEGEKPPAAKKSTAIPSTQKTPVVAITSEPAAEPMSEKAQIIATDSSSRLPISVSGPAAASTRLPSASEKKHGGVQVSEKELEEADSPKASDPMEEDPYKRARALARVIKIFIWVVGILFPLFFLGLAIGTAVMNEKEVPNTNDSNSDLTYTKPSNKATFEGKDPLNQAITVAASAWPIVFAAVVAQSLKMYAAYRVERGIKLVTLEQLISSHSVGGAIKQPFMLRTFNWTTLMLFFIWCLSPLAGQAILRMSTTTDIYRPVNTTVSYFSAQTVAAKGVPSNWEWYGETPENKRVGLAIPNAITVALIQGYGQSQNASQDIYRNLRIPAALGTTISSYIRPDSHHRQDEIIYTSLLGYPFWIKEERNNPSQSTSFDMLSSYFSFNCSEPELVYQDGPEMRSYNLTLNTSQNMDSVAFSAENNTHSWYEATINSDGPTVFPNGSVYNPPSNQSRSQSVNISYTEPGPTGTLHFATLESWDDSGKPQFSLSQCLYQNVVVETTFYCVSVEQNATCESYYWGSQEVSEPKYPAMSLGYWFPFALQDMANAGSADVSELTQFLRDPGFAARRDYGGKDVEPGISGVTGAQLSERLNLVANALWSVQQDIRAFVGTGQPTWFNETDTLDALALADMPKMTIYVVDWLWLGILVACSVLLTIAALAAAIWETRVIGPDFLGFANTAVKKSVKLPKSLSTIDARDRLHALQECEVLLQDMRPDRPVGRIALGVKEEGSTRLEPGRRYR